jgi:hypothetical protein
MEGVITLRDTNGGRPIVTVAAELHLSKSVYLQFLGTGLYLGNHKGAVNNGGPLSWMALAMKMQPTAEIMAAEATEVDKTATQKCQLMLERATMCDRTYGTTV